MAKNKYILITFIIAMFLLSAAFYWYLYKKNTDQEDPLNLFNNKSPIVEQGADSDDPLDLFKK